MFYAILKNILKTLKKHLPALDKYYMFKLSIEVAIY